MALGLTAIFIIKIVGTIIGILCLLWSFMLFLAMISDNKKDKKMYLEGADDVEEFGEKILVGFEKFVKYVLIIIGLIILYIVAVVL